MSDVVVLSAIAPMMGEPNVRSTQVSQMVLGETASVLEQRGEWLHLRRDEDGYTGFAHRGYLSPPETSRATSWRLRAIGRADGAVVRDTGTPVALPLLARLAPLEIGWELPRGGPVELVAGTILPLHELIAEARRSPAVQWAAARFSGTPYLWGGVTPWGADCSGLVQTAFAARGIPLPRDAAQQVEQGRPVDPEDLRTGDLLFFAENGDRITHVAMADGRDSLAHSTLACGGFIIEPWSNGARAAALREQLVAVRRVG